MYKKRKLWSLLKMKCKSASFEYLLKEKESRSKMSKIKYSELNIQSYLISGNINLRKKQLLFKLRTRMMSTPENFGKSRDCKICEIDRDTTSHVMTYIFLKCQVPEGLNLDSNGIEIVFGKDLTDINQFLNIFEKMWRKREELLDKFNTTVSEEIEL